MRTDHANAHDGRQQRAESIAREAIVRECRRCGTSHPLESDTPVRNPTALAQLCPKLAELGERIDDMPEDEYGGWLHALPFAEFLEFIMLEDSCLAVLMRASPCDIAKEHRT